MRAAARLPPIDPSGKPQYISETMFNRSAFGEASDVIAMMIGMAPPSPKPVTRRTNKSACSVRVRGVTRELTAKSSIAMARMALRPKRSAA